MCHCNEEFTLKNKNYIVEISFTSLSRLRGEDSSLYDEVLDPHNLEAHVPPSVCDVLSIAISARERKRRIALIAGVYKSFGHIAILEADLLIILSVNTPMQINLQEGKLLKVGYPPTGPYDLFSIYATKYGYLVHGERHILMLDRELNVLWLFTNGNTFINSKHNNEFTIEKRHETVRFYDMSGNFYRLSLATGDLIDSIPSA